MILTLKNIQFSGQNVEKNMYFRRKLLERDISLKKKPGKKTSRIWLSPCLETQPHYKAFSDLSVEHRQSTVINIK